MECKSRKEDHFQNIYEVYSDDIFRLCMHYTKNYDVSQEITQNVFFKLYLHMDHVSLDSIRPWLVRTAKNMVYNHSRDSRYEMLGEVIELMLDKVDPEASLEEKYVRNEQRREAGELCHSILGRLYVEHQGWYEALILVYCLEKTQLEAANELGITLEVLHSRLYRAKQWIRKNYERKYRETVNWR